MLKKTITFHDLEGNEVTDDFYFNLTKAELLELELSEEGGFAENIQEIAKSNDGKKIIETFKEIIRRSYGVKSEDGRRFIKSPELFEEFSQTDAFSELFMQLATDASAGASFVNGVVPAQLAQQVADDMANLSDEEKRAKAVEGMEGHKPKKKSEKKSDS